MVQIACVVQWVVVQSQQTAAQVVVRYLCVFVSQWTKPFVPWHELLFASLQPQKLGVVVLTQNAFDASRPAHVWFMFTNAPQVEHSLKLLASMQLISPGAQLPMQPRPLVQFADT